MQKKTRAVCGEGAGTDRLCQSAGDVSCWRPLAGRRSRVGGAAVEAVSDPTGTLTENSQRSTTQEIDILKISKSIKLLVKMKFLSFILQEKLNILANPIFTREKQNYVHMK